VLRLLAFACVVFGLTTAVRANLVNVGALSTTVNMNAGTQSAFVTIPIYDSAPLTSTSLVAWSLGLRVTPVGGATGSVTIDPTFAYPSGNILTSPNPSGAPQSTPNSPTTGDITVGAANTGFTPVVVTAGGQNLVQLKFNASAGASGQFALQLVDDGTPAYTYWTDSSFNDNPFLVNNVPVVLSTQIGTIQVTPAAVPEPSSMLLTAGLLGAAGWRARRKRKAAAAATAETPVPPA
jgi:hypothetical protein